MLFHLAQAAQRRALGARKRREARKFKQQHGLHTVLHTAAHTPAVHPAACHRSARQTIGDTYETRACELLERAGLRIIGRQLSCRAGEIDLVACEQNTLVFVEVRARSALTHGGAAASVTRSKQLRLIRAITWWLPRLSAQYFRCTTPVCRIDVIAFDPRGVRWLQDAIRL
jgi:putative endonuclease